MTLSHLLPELSALPDLIDLAVRLADDRTRVAVSDLPLAARPAVAAAVLATHSGPALILTSRADRADALIVALNEFLPPERQARLWPAPEALPYEQLPFDLTVSTERVALLARLLQPVDDLAPILVAPARALFQLILPPAELTEQLRTIRVGDRLDVNTLVRSLTELGYQLAPLVQEPGTIARRGGIIDIFPAGASQPVRIDLFGDEVESLRAFNPGSQRSDARMRSVTLLPPCEFPLWRLREVVAELARLDTRHLRGEVAGEWRRMVEQMQEGHPPSSVDLFAPYLLDQQGTLLDYFSASSLVIVDEPSAVSLAASQLEDQAAELQSTAVANGELPPNLRRPIATWTAIGRSLDSFRRLDLGLAGPESEATARDLSAIVEAPAYAGRMSRLVDDVAERLAQGWRIAVATDQVERLTELFEEQQIYPRHEKRRGAAAPRPLPPGTLEVRASDLDGGWMVPAARLLVLSDQELFGFRKQTRRGERQRAAENAAFAASLTPGEYVVHVDHGIARFIGLTRLETNGVEREYLHLEYARGDKLYVPVDQSDRVTRYSGGGIEPTPSRLGSGEWVRVKRRVHRAVREMAFELIQLYASRETAEGRVFPIDAQWDVELAESFPYSETADQQRALEDVKQDMESIKPMDRLVCGDVGFGKTEVALRAAFKAVNAGAQVAILVPTTVLALQHFTTFSQRLAPFPVKVEMLSRLRGKQEQKEILTSLAQGGVDIVIGTHRLVQKDVKFKDLGLVVIDEEQRFGVRQKEFLKQLRSEVDVLTMSATPIPRTLHLSLAGIRDISIIDTAPQARLPIRTFVTQANDRMLREVILREIDRGGQIYFVHNRVHSINRMAHQLRELVPEARIGVGHGQMEEDVLEEIVLGFVRHDYDVLVSTTIIESGIDIPNVNTIVIDNADTLGLTQLYQLRGRVGRSPVRAYAYLIYRPGKALSLEARERLEAIQEATELGAGLRVAMRDMEIRGAGNILGAEQSGHIADVGFDLYMRLLSQAVEEIRSGQPRGERSAVTLDLPLTALIPADYIVDTELRLATYRQIAGVTSLPELDGMRQELFDRFGDTPDEVEHLFALIAIRIRCEELGIDSVLERERELVIRPVTTSHLNERLLRAKLGHALKLTPNSVRIRLPDLDMPWQTALDSVLDAVESVAVSNRELAVAS